MREVPIPPHITILFVEQEVKHISLVPAILSRDFADRRRRHHRPGFGVEG